MACVARFVAVAATATLFATLLNGCQTGAPSARAQDTKTTLLPAATAPARGAEGASPVRYVDVAESAGLRHEWRVSGERPLNILQTIGNGCAFLDYNGDGNLDVLLVDTIPVLFRGDGKGRFVNVSQQTGVANLRSHFLGCAVGDYDNDGDADIYLSGWRTGALLRNENGARFQDVTKEAGLAPQPWGTSCGWADLDGDGLLDLYVSNYVAFGPDTKPQLCKFNTQQYGVIDGGCGPRYYTARKGVVYHNRAGNRFTDVSKAWGVNTQAGKGLGVAFADFDESGRLGFAVANDEMPGDLFQNLGGAKGDAQMENIGIASGTAFGADGDPHAGMGIDWGDYNNDGRVDLFVAAFHNEPKSLYRNDGDGLFTDMSFSCGVGTATLPFLTFGSKFLDVDNDGWLDLMLANGHVLDNIEKIENTTYRQPTQLLRNNAGTFEDVTRQAGADLLRPIVGRGLASGDYDNDGRVDALVVDSEGKPLLLHNESTLPKDGWIGFRLIGRGTKGVNRDAYGATVTLVLADGRKLVRQCHPGGSYLSSSDPRVHFGLGTAAAGASAVSSVMVRWPGGQTETLRNLVPGKYHTLQQGAAGAVGTSVKGKRPESAEGGGREGALG